MAGNAELELDGAGWLLIFLVVGGIFALIYFAVRGVRIPESWYPYPVFDRFASGVDTTLARLPGGLKPISDPFGKSADQMLGTIGAWIDENLPRTPTEAKSLADGGEAQYSDPSGVEEYDGY